MEILPGDELKLSCTFKSTSHSSTVYYGDSTQDEMCLGYLFYYPVHPFHICFQFGGLTVCHNESNSDELADCPLSVSPAQGGIPAEQRAAYQLGSKCDITGKTCTSDCLSLLTENPHPCLRGDAKLFGEFMFPMALGPEIGKELQSASRSCDVQIHDGSASLAIRNRSIFGKMTLVLVAILVPMKIMRY